MALTFGLHLPVLGWGGRPTDPRLVRDVAVRGERAGFEVLCANDHLVYGSPWLDCIVALATAGALTSRPRLMTTVALPVVRGPWALAKALAAIDVLSDGRVDAGLGPGSSAADYALAGVSFDERWPRFDESVGAIRSAWSPDPGSFSGRFYRSGGPPLEPRPAQPGGPPIWIGSWGSEAGLRRVARLADGWLASAYNTTPTAFGQAWIDVQALREARPDRPAPLRNALATAFLAIVPNRTEARRIVDLVIASGIHRSVEELEARLLIGDEPLIVERLSAYAEAGLERALVWPVVDEVAQLERFAERVMPAFAS
jgi:alkanesulfonate monooxygenase SsuD/methylene tetrahydromethanopterin reductase-like flavin-dependent oxidoreductase (luciferase family)